MRGREAVKGWGRNWTDVISGEAEPQPDPRCGLEREVHHRKGFLITE